MEKRRMKTKVVWKAGAGQMSLDSCSLVDSSSPILGRWLRAAVIGQAWAASEPTTTLLGLRRHVALPKVNASKPKVGLVDPRTILRA